MSGSDLAPFVAPPKVPRKGGTFRGSHTISGTSPSISRGTTRPRQLRRSQSLSDLISSSRSSSASSRSFSMSTSSMASLPVEEGWRNDFGGGFENFDGSNKNCRKKGKPAANHNTFLRNDFAPLVDSNNCGDGTGSNKNCRKKGKPAANQNTFLRNDFAPLVDSNNCGDGTGSNKNCRKKGKPAANHNTFLRNDFAPLVDSNNCGDGTGSNKNCRKKGKPAANHNTFLRNDFAPLVDSNNCGDGSSISRYNNKLLEGSILGDSFSDLARNSGEVRTSWATKSTGSRPSNSSSSRTEESTHQRRLASLTDLFSPTTREGKK
ncbi:hypothetical protein FRACYDRAFT_255508 [Fragilariopsis cylindrus CCMP1102]|uniref:Uncharacterized protein n=1 Tax=Fragilariopsis cylindrus CCMP1102 TaxID=635003 RepID=A0A1E7EK09_9STRA|nr:hypothetical protein FRACYDRAFT_255508 [Fragilariopsis cylindrus CCMP1102]|eukprot:OEU06261.1 hypothetical protein FRACYDRAFT_255508 [Fragilariopsis cylindrus CCMP1102]